MLKSQIYKRRTQNHFYKIYSKDVLLDSFEKIEIRLNLPSLLIRPKLIFFLRLGVIETSLVSIFSKFI